PDIDVLGRLSGAPERVSAPLGQIVRKKALMGVSYLVPAASPITTAADADRAGIRIGVREWKRHLRKSRSGILSDHNSTDAPRCRADILKSKALPRSVKSAGCWLELSSARQSQDARRYPQVVWAG